MAKDQQEVKPEEVVAPEPIVPEAEPVATPPEETDTPSEPSPEEKPIEPEIAVPPVVPKKEPAPVDGETPREHALRLQVEELRAQRRNDRAKEISVRPAIVKSSPQMEELRKKYNPDEVKNWEELMEEKIREMGLVRKEDKFQEDGEEDVSAFFREHPEYDSEHDKEGFVYNRFKQEFQRFNPTTSRKELRKNLEDAHQKVFGIQPSGNAGIINAQREKVKVASHAGASQGGRPSTPIPSGLRLDMLKGFDDEEGQKELEELARRATT